jgi:hypothetical protein
MRVSPSIPAILAPLCLALSWVLCADPIPFAAIAATMAADSMPPDRDMPVYKPPKGTAPRSRIDDGIRGSPGHEPTIVALVPDHVGFTIKKDPTLYWYLHRVMPLPVRFTLIDSRSIRPIVEVMLSPPTRPGVQRVPLREFGITLDPGMQYRWYVSLVVDANKPSGDLVTGGMIERVDFNEGSALGFPLDCEKDAVHRYAEAGLWYDAISCISELIESNPHDALLRKQRAFLLHQIDLLDVDQPESRQNGHR